MRRPDAQRHGKSLPSWCGFILKIDEFCFKNRGKREEIWEENATFRPIAINAP